MSSNIFVTFGSLAGTEQLQTRTRSGFNQLTTQTRTRTLASGSTTQTYERTRSVTSSTVYTRFTRSCPVGQICTGSFWYETIGAACSGSCATAQCAAGVTYCRTRFGPTGCQYFVSSISDVCNCENNWSSESYGFLCSSITGLGACGSELIQYCTGSTSCSVGDWSGWSVNNSCTTQTSSCGGTSYTTRECENFSDPTCTETSSWTSWSNVGPCSLEYGTNNCSGSLIKDCQTLTSCVFTDWSNWSDVNVCVSTSPTCEQSRDQGTLQRQCQVV